MFRNGTMINHMDQSIRYLIVTILFIYYVKNIGMVSATVAPKLAPTVRLNNGYEFPVVGLGTYLSKSGECEQAVKDAIDAGYRHIDSAYLYGNEKEVGNAVRAKIAEGVIKREDIFITTKLWSTFHKPEQVEKAFRRSFDNLNLDYIDLFLIHSPTSYKVVSKSNPSVPPTDVDDVNLFPVGPDGKALSDDVDYIDTWRALEQLVKTGLVRSIGVSNFNSEQVERVNSIAEIKPVTNQVECHPNLNQRKLIKFCADRNITVTAYSPLGRPHLVNQEEATILAIHDPKVKSLAEKYNKTVGQIVLRYLVQNGAIVIPKSTNKARIQENINIFDFELSSDDVEILHGLNTNTRLVPFAEDADAKYYPFAIEY